MTKTVISACFVFLGAIALACDNVDEGSSMDERLSGRLGPTTVIGEFQSIANPATTVPPLPGAVDAVVTGRIGYILTENSSWSWGDEPFYWGDQQPEYGDYVIVEGMVSKHEDLNGRVYYEIEVRSFVVLK